MNTNFENVSFEKDIQDFSKEVREHQVKNKIENIQETHVKDLLKLRFNQSQISQPQKGRAGSSVLQESDSLPDYLITESSQVKDKVNDLISLAFSKG
ncbi:MAG: hypothetical protein AAB621_01565, partial [Patescibacteria group bacterium]